MWREWNYGGCGEWSRGGCGGGRVVQVWREWSEEGVEGVE